MLLRLQKSTMWLLPQGLLRKNLQSELLAAFCFLVLVFFLFFFVLFVAGMVRLAVLLQYLWFFRIKFKGS